MDKRVRPGVGAIDQSTRTRSSKTIVRLRKEARKEWRLWLPHMPAEWGGMGLGPTAMAAVSAEAAKVGDRAVRAQRPGARRGQQHTLLHWATDEQKEKYLRPLCEGTARVVLRDDRARGRRLRPDADPDVRLSRTATSG